MSLISTGTPLASKKKNYKILLFHFDLIFALCASFLWLFKLKEPSTIGNAKEIKLTY